jgi:hypothetical protein
MDKDELTRRLRRRMEQDDDFAENIEEALDTEDDSWLYELVRSVIGTAIETIVETGIRYLLRSLFGW